MIAGATLYGFSMFIVSDGFSPSHQLPAANATEEFFVRKRPLYEVVGQLGMFGFIVCGIQAASLEHEGMKTASWNGATSKLCHFVAYPDLRAFQSVYSSRTRPASVSVHPLCLESNSVLNLAMFILYTVAPLLYRMASSAYYNLSLLSSDWYGLIFGTFHIQILPHLCSYILLRFGSLRTSLSAGGFSGLTY